ncbi:MAG TPA: AmmeMemoRadiSam system protein B [Thermoanaerobaculia bacterium]|nr:AmmeMemoRadiSam system protein B [Thermoanaerobaculia bacterium]
MLRGSGLAVRPPAVAGSFYPESPWVLAGAVDRYLEAAAARAPKVPPPAVIAPHAGYVYSGPVAGSAFAAWRDLDPPVRRIVLLGPNHYLPVRGIALPDASAMATPLGEVPVALELCVELLELPAVHRDAAAHAPEHSLEVELPFLQRLLGEFEVVPLLVGEAAPEEVAAVLRVAWRGPETRVVVSSDLSHYLAYEEARLVDRATADQIRAGEAGLVPFQACGARAINGLLVEVARRGLAAEVLDLRNSGDTAGPRDQVVGYGAFAFGSATDA